MKKMLVAGIAASLALSLAACGGNASEPAEQSAPAEVSAPAVESTEAVDPFTGQEETGGGTIEITTPGGSTADGIIPVYYLDPDEVGPEVGFNAWDFDGSTLSFIYIDGEFVEKEQLADTQMGIVLSTEQSTAEGVHTVQVVQYEGGEEGGTIVTFKTAQYEIKPE